MVVVFASMENDVRNVKIVGVVVSVNTKKYVHYVQIAMVTGYVGVMQSLNVGISATKNMICTVRIVSGTSSRTIRVLQVFDQNPKKFCGSVRYCNRQFYVVSIGYGINLFMYLSTVAVAIRSVESISGR